LTTKNINIAVLGAGTWGCTLGALLAEKRFPIRMWDISAEILETLKANRVHPKLPWLHLPENVSFEYELASAVNGAEYLIIVTPSHAVRSLSAEMQKANARIAEKKFVICSKGIEQGSLLPLSGVVEDILGAAARDSICCLTGPTHAEEVSRKMPSSIVAASAQKNLAIQVQEIFHTEFLRVYFHDDLIGVQLGGSVKNVIAIAAGVSDGLGFGDNTKAALLTRGLAEIIRLGAAMGARAETFSGLSGIGDLIVTATSHHSRNRNFGELIAKGRTVEEALREIGMVVEGVKTADSVLALSQKYQVSMPISQEVYNLIYMGKKPLDALRDLMGRSPKPEIYL